MWKRLIALIRHGELDRGLNAEMRFHIDMETDKNIRLGGRGQLTLRVQSFNVLNHPNQGLPLSDWADRANFGTIVDSANAPRAVELVTKLSF